MFFLLESFPYFSRTFQMILGDEIEKFLSEGLTKDQQSNQNGVG
jgi:hypothetical protein